MDRFFVVFVVFLGLFINGCRQPTAPDSQMANTDSFPNITSTDVEESDNLLAVGYSTGGIRIFALPDFRQVWMNEDGHSSKIVSLDYSADGDFLVSADENGRVLLWEMSVIESVKKQEIIKLSSISYANFMSPGLVAILSDDGSLRLIRLHWEKGKFFTSVERICQEQKE